MRTVGFILLLSLIVLFTGCASTGFLMATPQVNLFGQTYPPKDDEATIEVFRTNTPTQDYIEIAQITFKDSSDKWNLDQILKKARENGADGIVILGKAGF
jgi:hypothetical protein